MINRPILLGKLNQVENIYTLMGHMGDVEQITHAEYEILKLMDGFNTIEEIAKFKNVSVSKVIEVYNLFQGHKKITTLYDWNKVGWCEECRVHVAGEKCGICGKQTKKIVFSPPCDPFIAFEVEQKFILNVLKEKYKIELPDNSLFLVNNGVKNNIFFWEVEYAGEIILKIDFRGMSQDKWEYAVITKSKEIIEQRCLLNEDVIEKTIVANKDYLKKLENKSIAIIAESSAFFTSAPLLYFSGGKESMIMLSLIKKTGIKVNALTVVTGVEFPDDISFIKEMKKEIEKIPTIKYFFYEDDGNKIIRTLILQGKLSAKNPWCRVDFKRNLKSKGTDEIYRGKEFVAYEGSRWYENDFRRRHPKVNFISDYSHQVWVHPLAEWTSFEVWLYIIRERIPINSIYFKGFQRTTCWLCPIVNPFHMLNSKTNYPELWEQIATCTLDAFEDDETHDLPF